jgi:flagellar hook-associated protein 3 FlgL
MRIATKTIYGMAKYHLGAIAEEMYKTNEVIASGKKINRPSDDPVGMTQCLQLKSELSNIEQLQSNITLGTSWLTSAESALTQVQDLISDAKALCTQMATSTTDAGQRSSAALEIENAREEIIALANTEVGGRYLFAGSDSDAVPFDEDGVYSGNDNGFTIKIGKDATLEIGRDGGDMFSDVFSTFQDFKDALEANDLGGIQGAMDQLDDQFDNVSSQISDVGSKMVRLETRSSILDSLNLTTTKRLSDIEDTDITDAVIDLESIEVTYQAALASSAAIMKLSLVDYFS